MGASFLMSKIINFNDAKLKKVHPRDSSIEPDCDERRRHKRMASNDKLFAQIVACEERPGLVGTTLSCAAMNVSAGGLGIRSYEYIPKGSQLDLWVDIGSRPGKLFLTSDVRWITENSGSHHSYELGVALHEAPATDIEEWRDMYP
jgi:hypothetical protein